MDRTPAPLSRTMDGREVRLFPAGVPDAPIVYAPMFMEVGAELVDAARTRGCAPFSLVSVSHLRWDEELSPWPHDPVVSDEDHFTGESRGFLDWLLSELAPWVEAELGVAGYAQRIICGYSMAGLFALWSLYETDAFERAISCSGSLWYPGFRDFALARAPKSAPESVYLSLGDLESRCDNEALCTTETVTAELARRYREMDIPCAFELNEGDHYHDALGRLARGISWTLDRCAPAR